MDDYVKGVVPREMPASWMAEALRAQAVAARTYAAYDRAAHTTRSYDTCDTTSCQVFGGASSEDSRSNAAVVATAGQVVTYGGKPAFTQFGSSSGGWTSAGSMPYLTAKADPYDGFSGNPVHTWTKSVTKAAVQKRVAVARHPDARGGDPARRPRRVVRPGGVDGARRHQEERHHLRRHLPLEVRAALELVPVRRRGSAAPERRR